MSAPAAIMVALLMVPETEPLTSDHVMPPQQASSTMDAIVTGTENGVKIVIGIIALLIAVVALVNLADQILALLPDIAGAPLSLERIFGLVLTPLAWLLGLPWDEAATGGDLLATKVILTELVSYLDLAALPQGALSERSRIIMTYALCGFSSFAALGILIGGLAAMVPERRGDIVALGPRSILAGLMATCSTGCVVGILI
jgi:CNT family concentrative nucleoside transporter